MKIYLSLILLFLIGCSFDNKSGIWKNENDPNINQKNDSFASFKSLSSSNKVFNEVIPFNNKKKIKLSKRVSPENWTDIFFNSENNYENFEYKNKNKLSFKSKKISGGEISNFILKEKDKIITSNNVGDIFIFSLKEKKIVSKFNFYKKKYKRIKKNLNLIVEDNTIFVSDNIGYLYSFNYKLNKILWAKNYKIPFRSNLKIIQNKLVGANQNNTLYFFDKITGDILKQIPTEESVVKNEFKNNLSIGKNYTFFLNTYGTLYTIDNKSLKIIWFLNLNQSTDLNSSNLFSGSQIVNFNDKIFVSSNIFTYILNQQTGEILFRKNFSTKIKPIINNINIFLITKNNYLVAFSSVDGKIIYSYNINKEISKFLKIKKGTAILRNIFIVNGKIYVFLKNSYILKFNIDGGLYEVIKLPYKIQTDPIFSDKELYYIDKKNKILSLS